MLRVEEELRAAAVGRAGQLQTQPVLGTIFYGMSHDLAIVIILVAICLFLKCRKATADSRGSTFSW